MPPPVRHCRFPLPATSSRRVWRQAFFSWVALSPLTSALKSAPARKGGGGGGLLGDAETAWRVAGDGQGGHHRRQVGPGRCRNRAQATRPVSGRRLRPVPESPPAAGTPAHLPGQVPRQPATGSVIRSLQRSRTQVRSWEQNGSGGPLPGTVRSGHRAWLDVCDVQRHRITAVSPGCALSRIEGVRVTSAGASRQPPPLVPPTCPGTLSAGRIRLVTMRNCPETPTRSRTVTDRRATAAPSRYVRQGGAYRCSCQPPRSGSFGPRNPCRAGLAEQGRCSTKSLRLVSRALMLYPVLGVPLAELKRPADPVTSMALAPVNGIDAYA